MINYILNNSQYIRNIRFSTDLNLWGLVATNHEVFLVTSHELIFNNRNNGMETENRFQTNSFDVYLKHLIVGQNEYTHKVLSLIAKYKRTKKLRIKEKIFKQIIKTR